MVDMFYYMDFEIYSFIFNEKNIQNKIRNNKTKLIIFFPLKKYIPSV